MFAGVLGFLGGSKMLLKIIAIGVVAALIFGFYMHYRSLVNSRDDLLEQRGRLSSALAVSQQANEKILENAQDWQKAYETATKTLQDVLARDNEIVQNVEKVLKDVPIPKDKAEVLKDPVAVAVGVNSRSDSLVGMLVNTTAGNNNGASNPGTTP